MKQRYGFKDMPYAGDLESMSAFMMVNSNPTLDGPDPLPPNVIEIGGLQIKDPKPLPQDLESFVNSSKKGTVLFSLGTNVKSSELGLEKQQMIVEAFRQIPEYNFLWKFETQFPLELPINVKIKKFMPQNDILAHSKTKLFITHAGLLSSQEATWYGVPMIGIPFIIDQFRVSL